MARIHKERLVSDINITPLTDVILVLLVIFMVTTPIIYQSNIKVNLPSAKSAVPPEAVPPGQANVTITTEGMLYLNDKLVTQQELRDQVMSLYQKDPGLGVYLRSDKLTKFKDIVQVLDLLTELGITKLDIAATREQDAFSVSQQP